MFKKRLQWRLLSTLSLSLMMLTFSGICYASDPYQMNTGMPWDTFVNVLLTEFTGPMAKIFATFAMTMAGIMLMFGEAGGLFKKSLHIVFGVSIAINIGDWITFIKAVDPSVNGVSVTAPTSMTNVNFLSAFMNYLISTCQQGAYNLQTPALELLFGLAVLEIALFVSFNYEQDHLKYIFKETLKIGFFVFLVEQWVGGTYGLADRIFESFEILGLKAAGYGVVGGAGTLKAGMVNLDQIVGYSLTIVDAIWKNATSSLVESIVLIIPTIMMICGIVLSTFFMVIEIFICKAEFWIISVLTIPLIPFGINKYTSFLFEKATGAIFNMGIKLMVISFVSVIAGPLFKTMSDSVASSPPTIATGFDLMLRVLLGCLLLYVLVKKVPEMAQGLLSGSPSLGGGDMKQAAMGAVGMPVKAASMAMGAAGVALTAKGMEGSMVGNLGKLAMAKMSSPFHKTMDDQIHNIGKRQQNNNTLNAKTPAEEGVFYQGPVGANGTHTLPPDKPAKPEGSGTGDSFKERIDKASGVNM